MLLFPDDSEAVETLRFLEKTLGVGAFLFLVNTGHIVWSDGIFDLLGIPPGSKKPSIELLHDMTHPEDRHSQLAPRFAASTGVPRDRTFRIIRRNGKIVWLRSQIDVFMGPDGMPERVVGVAQDITALVELERNARINETRSRAFSTVCGARPWIAAPDGTIIDAPDATGRHDAESLKRLGQGWLDRVHPDDRDAVRTAWAGAIANASPFSVYHRNRQPTGEYKLCRSGAFPAKDSNGTVTEWLGATVDVEDRSPTVDGPDALDLATGAQMRAARGILNWSVRDLSERAGVSTAVLRRLEAFDGHASGSAPQIRAVKAALQDAGIEFITFGHGHPTVRLR